MGVLLVSRRVAVVLLQGQIAVTLVTTRKELVSRMALLPFGASPGAVVVGELRALNGCSVGRQPVLIARNTVTTASR